MEPEFLEPKDIDWETFPENKPVSIRWISFTIISTLIGAIILYATYPSFATLADPQIIIAFPFFLFCFLLGTYLSFRLSYMRLHRIPFLAWGKEGILIQPPLGYGFGCLKYRLISWNNVGSIGKKTTHILLPKALMRTPYYIIEFALNDGEVYHMHNYTFKSLKERDYYFNRIAPFFDNHA